MRISETEMLLCLLIFETEEDAPGDSRTSVGLAEKSWGESGGSIALASTRHLRVRYHIKHMLVLGENELIHSELFP
jgi:hypothetical protein